MENAVSRMDRRACAGGSRFDVNRPLRTAGIESRISPRGGPRDEKLQRSEGQETEADERRTARHWALWYTQRR